MESQGPHRQGVPPTKSSAPKIDTSWHGHTLTCSASGKASLISHEKATLADLVNAYCTVLQLNMAHTQRLASVGFLFLVLRVAISVTTLFNGGQDIVFEDAPAECLAAFDQQLECDDMVQLLSYDLDSLELTDASLLALCKPACDSSLSSLHATVSSACGDYSIDFNGASITALEVVDLFAYKYNMTCMTDSSDAFCLMIEETWDVDSLNTSGQATWPSFTEKIYPDFSGGSFDGAPAEDVDGTLLDLSDDPISWPDWASQLDLLDSGENYFMEPLPTDWRGHGHDSPLEYDEYPLQIQCSERFLGQYRHGIESKWGEVYE